MKKQIYSLIIVICLLAGSLTYIYVSRIYAESSKKGVELTFNIINAPSDLKKVLLDLI